MPNYSTFIGYSLRQRALCFELGVDIRKKEKRWKLGPYTMMTAQAGSDQGNKYCVSLTTQRVKHGLFLDDHQSRNKPGPTGFTFDKQTSRFFNLNKSKENLAS